MAFRIRVCVLCVLFSGVVSRGAAPMDAPIVTGERKVWHPVTVSFRGPAASETDAAPNPFLDFRLQVTFTDPAGRTCQIPGFFDGNGHGKGTGDIWSVRFAPQAAGVWSFRASFRRGARVAVSLDPDAGKPGLCDGQSGTFEVAQYDPGSPGFLAQGRLAYMSGRFYLRTLGDSRYWIKGGCNSPENFLAYAGFSNTTANPQHPDWFHDYDRHVGHWKAGDPDWGGGRGRGIIGALNYLASQQVNSIYVLLMNIGGDGQDVWPFVGKIDRRGHPDNDNLHYDITKLNQWETVFAHAQRLGIALHLVLNEGEQANKAELDDATLGTERKLYYREMAARFGHHNGVVWNLCEEYNMEGNRAVPPEMITSWARYLKSVDAGRHPVTVHNNNHGEPMKILPVEGFAPFFGRGDIDLLSVQFREDQFAKQGRGPQCRISNGDMVQRLRRLSAQAGRAVPVGMDEPERVVPVDDESHAVDFPMYSGQSYLRKAVLWPTYLSGGSIEWILDRALETDDFAQFESIWKYTWYARRLLEELPFWEMEPTDELLEGEATYGNDDGQVFARPGEVYAIYLPKANPSGTLDLTDAPGNYSLRWYDPRTGRFVQGSRTVHGGRNMPIGPPPGEKDEDWVVLLQAVQKHQRR